MISFKRLKNSKLSNTKKKNGADYGMQVRLLSWAHHQAPMAELVDAYVSGAYIERCAGSTPVRGTREKETLTD